MPIDSGCGGNVALSIVKPSKPKKPRVPWRETGCFLAWAPTVAGVGDLLIRWAHVKKHPASLQGTLGFLGFDDFTMENATFPYRKPMDVLGFQGWVSCGRFLVAELLLYSRSFNKRPPHLQWGLGHKKPSTRNQTLNPQDAHRFFAWESHDFHRRSIEIQGTQGTLEGDRVFLRMGSHCNAYKRLGTSPGKLFLEGLLGTPRNWALM